MSGFIRRSLSVALKTEIRTRFLFIRTWHGLCVSDTPGSGFKEHFTSPTQNTLTIPRKCRHGLFLSAVNLTSVFSFDSCPFTFPRNIKMTLKVGKIRQLGTYRNGIFQMTILEMEYFKFGLFLWIPGFTCRVVQNLVVYNLAYSPGRYKLAFSH